MRVLIRTDKAGNADAFAADLLGDIAQNTETGHHGKVFGKRRAGKGKSDNKCGFGDALGHGSVSCYVWLKKRSADYTPVHVI